VMPYIEGETLRSKLDRDKQLGIEEAVQITREVADALAYAHRHGVIHRDIKPENILLTGDHALVADFGIARAVAVAGDARITETGLVLGTPLYMSPEQAVGEREIGGRSDVYSLGCVLYELLAGHAPFTGASAQEVLARHTLDPVPRITAARPGLPGHVEEALERALAKTPADRFPTASAFGAALAHRPTAPPARARVAMAGIGLAAIAAFTIGTWLVFREGGPGTLLGSHDFATSDAILLADFTPAGTDSTFAFAVTEGLRVSLGGSRLIRVLGTAQVRSALVKMNVPPDTPLGDSLAQQVALRENAPVFVTGTVARLGGSYQLSAQLVRTADGAVLRAERTTASSEEGVIPAVDQLGGRLRRGMGEALHSVASRERLSEVTTASLPALRAFSARRSTQDREQHRALLMEAIRLDSSFAMAWEQLAVLHTNEGNISAARQAANAAYRFRARLPEVERLDVELVYHLARCELGPMDALLERAAVFDAPYAYNQMAYLALRRGRLQAAESLALLSLSLPTPHPRLPLIAGTNAFEARIGQRRLVAAESLVTSPNRLTQDYRTSNLMLARRDYPAAERFYGEWVREGRAAARVAAVRRAWVLALQGRIREASLELSDSLAWAPFVARTVGDTAGARRTVTAWRRAVSWDSLPPEQRPYQALVPALAQVGHYQEAERLYSEWQQVAQSDQCYQAEQWPVAGWLAVRRGRPEAALDAFQSWNRGPYLRNNYDRGLAEAGLILAQLGQTDSAVASFEAALARPNLGGVEYAAVWYPTVIEELGVLHAQQGHRAEAIEYTTRFIELWQRADPELQPRVRAARLRLSSLTTAPPAPSTDR